MQALVFASVQETVRWRDFNYSAAMIPVPSGVRVWLAGSIGVTRFAPGGRKQLAKAAADWLTSWSRGDGPCSYRFISKLKARYGCGFGRQQSRFCGRPKGGSGKIQNSN